MSDHPHGLATTDFIGNLLIRHQIHRGVPLLMTTIQLSVSRQVVTISCALSPFFIRNYVEHVPGSLQAPSFVLPDERSALPIELY